jgi:hypothetical protein
LYLATEINDYSLSQLQLDRLEMALTKIKPEESMILLKYQEGACKNVAGSTGFVRKRS